MVTGEAHSEGAYVTIWFLPSSLVEQHAAAGYSAMEAIRVAPNAAKELLGKSLALKFLWG
jgi:hypothetical protein